MFFKINSLPHYFLNLIFQQNIQTHFKVSCSLEAAASQNHEVKFRDFEGSDQTSKIIKSYLPPNTTII